MKKPLPTWSKARKTVRGWTSSTSDSWTCQCTRNTWLQNSKTSDFPTLISHCCTWLWQSIGPTHRQKIKMDWTSLKACSRTNFRSLSQTVTAKHPWTISSWTLYCLQPSHPSSNSWSSIKVAIFSTRWQLAEMRRNRSWCRCSQVGKSPCSFSNLSSPWLVRWVWSS